MNFSKLLFFSLLLMVSSKDLVLIGDSRFCGIASGLMKIPYTYHNKVYGTGSYIVSKSAKSYQGFSVKVIAEVGASYGTFKNANKDVTKGVSSILGSSKAGTIVLLWLGVNNLNSDETFKYYHSLASQYKKLKFYAVSVTGVVESKAKISNATIKKFNGNLKNKIISSNLSNLKYKSILKKDDPTQIYNTSTKKVVLNVNSGTMDGLGLHYHNAGSKAIFNAMIAGL